VRKRECLRHRCRSIAHDVRLQFYSQAPLAIGMFVGPFKSHAVVPSVTALRQSRTRLLFNRRVWCIQFVMHLTVVHCQIICIIVRRGPLPLLCQLGMLSLCSCIPPAVPGEPASGLRHRSTATVQQGKGNRSRGSHLSQFRFTTRMFPASPGRNVLMPRA
jgi:hypothetical protein